MLSGPRCSGAEQRRREARNKGSAAAASPLMSARPHMVLLSPWTLSSGREGGRQAGREEGGEGVTTAGTGSVRTCFTKPHQRGVHRFSPKKSCIYFTQNMLLIRHFLKESNEKCNNLWFQHIFFLFWLKLNHMLSKSEMLEVIYYK